MNPTLLVLAFWLLVAIAIFSLRKLIIMRALDNEQGVSDDADPDAKTGGGYAPHSAWKELDTQMGKSGCGHHLQ